jgi:hypothetical protein
MIAVRRAGVLAWAITGLVIAAVVAALVITGTPAQARMRRLDEQRIDDLVEIVSAVRLYYEDHKSLPSQLSQMPNRVAATDPASGRDYSYRVIDPTHFELAAEFQTDNRKDNPRRYWYQNEDIPPKHRSGRVSYVIEAKHPL